MPIRPLKLPDDLEHIYTLIIEAFRYPENPEWNIDPDEVSRIRDTVETHLALHIFLRILNKMRRIEQRKLVVWKAESRDVEMGSNHVGHLPGDGFQDPIRRSPDGPEPKISSKQ